MSNQYGAKAYKTTQISTAPKEKVLLMLYEAAIRYTKIAIQSIENDNRVEKGKAIGKVHEIINELTNSLNFDIGGDVAKNLERLYMYITELLVKANTGHTVEPLNEVLKLLDTLYDGWKIAVSEFQKQGGQIP